MTLEKILEDIKTDRVKKVILDTDTFNEIDDQYALAYCYLSDKIDLLSVNAAPFFNGNSGGFEDGMVKSYEEIVKVLSILGDKGKTPAFYGSRKVIEENNFAPVESEAARNIIDTVKASDEIIYVLGIGACTNIASALLLDPSIKDNMCVIWLGGNPLGSDNLGEFNLVQDYVAGQLLINSGVPLLLCSAWGIVSELITNHTLTDELKDKNPICDYLYEITDRVRDKANPGWVRTIWDIAAPAILDIPYCADIEIITAPIFTDERVYAFDATRHKMLYLKSINREAVFEKTWKILM